MLREESRVALTCPSCGNDQNFLVKTLQMHVVHLDDSRVEVSEESRPAVLEVTNAKPRSISRSSTNRSVGNCC